MIWKCSEPTNKDILAWRASEWLIVNFDINSLVWVTLSCILAHYDRQVFDSRSAFDSMYEPNIHPQWAYGQEFSYITSQ